MLCFSYSPWKRPVTPTQSHLHLVVQFPSLGKNTLFPSTSFKIPIRIIIWRLTKFFKFYTFRRISNILHISGGFFHLSEPFKIDCAVFAPERKRAIKNCLTKITGGGWGVGMWINVTETLSRFQWGKKWKIVCSILLKTDACMLQ